MMADVTQDRRVTVPNRGLNPTAFVDGSRLFWALLSPVHERLGYRVLAPDRIQGDAVASALHIHGPVQDHVSSFISRPIVPTHQRSTVLAVVKAWPGKVEPGAPVQRRPVLTTAATRCSRRFVVGTEKRLSRTKKLTKESKRSLRLMSDNSVTGGAC
jgi:hypothetical protein